MPRFVVLRHELPLGSARPSHWDLMFEVGGALRTWAIESSPEDWHAEPGEALPLADHRLAYLDYEGAISDGRGTVARWDEGSYGLVCDTRGEWVVDLAGARLRGRLTLVAEGLPPADGGTAAAKSWRFGFVAGS
jgi:hypothetical protein